MPALNWSSHARGCCKEENVFESYVRMRSKKFTFALFAGAGIAGNSLNIVEKTGYLIKTDLNLENEQIFELNDEIDEKTFVNSSAFYHDDKFLNFN